MRLWLYRLSLVLLLFGVGCSLAGQDEGRTYPGVFRYEQVSIDTFFGSTPEAGRYNTRGYVIHINQCTCPKDVMCGPCPPDGIYLAASPSDTPTQDDVLFVHAERTGQFALGGWYEVSLELEPRRPEDSVLRRIDLLGYTRLR